MHLAPGYDRTPLPGKEVIVLGKECLYGVVAVMPPHLQANASHVDEYEHLVIDIGYPQEHACRLVSPGDVVIFLPQLDELADGHVSSPSIDDRAALASILLALDAVHKCELAVDVAVVASSREEIGGPGAQTVAYGLRPDYAIALDVTFGVQKGLDAPDGVPENCGVTITRGPHLNRRLTETLFRLAETEKILTVLRWSRETPVRTRRISARRAAAWRRRFWGFHALHALACRDDQAYEYRGGGAAPYCISVIIFRRWAVCVRGFWSCAG